MDLLGFLGITGVDHARAEAKNGNEISPSSSPAAAPHDKQDNIVNWLFGPMDTDSSAGVGLASYTRQSDILSPARQFESDTLSRPAKPMTPVTPPQNKSRALMQQGNDTNGAGGGGEKTFNGDNELIFALTENMISGSDNVFSDQDVLFGNPPVVLKVLSAQHLPQLAEGPCAVFARVEYGDHAQNTSIVHSVSPSWDMMFHFEYIPKQAMTVRVLHKHSEDADGVELGFVTVRHDVLISNSADLGTWFPLVRSSPLENGETLSETCPR